MTDTGRDYEVGHCKPPVATRFKKGQSGNPGGRSSKTAKSAPPLLIRQFNEQVVVVAGGRRQKTSRREMVIVQLVDQPAAAGLSTTKILADLLKDVEKKARPSPAA